MAQRALRMVPNGDEIAVVEVGAGQGVFLGLLAEAAGPRLALAAGFDPAWRGKPGDGNRIKLSSELFDAGTAGRLRRPPNLLISRHTIEHVARPLAFLRTVRAALGNRAVRIAIETPCIQWIFDNWAIQDLFFEHCSLFTAETLAAALNATGFRTTSVTHVFGGQYLWAEAVAVDPTAATGWSNTSKADFAAWHRRKDAMASNWDSFLNRRSAEGPVYVWGAGAKGVTFACLFDPGARLLRGLIDINPNKQGRFAPGSGAAIHAPAAIEPNATVVLMNSNYESEVSELCGRLGKSPLIVPFGELPPP
ncbi:MAG: methyltransferase domain-containing protein [Alphaproteobacteria bacterium]|nr:methyltransferase domain-containing protein [Alphaproteobacteria bacterium]